MNYAFLTGIILLPVNDKEEGGFVVNGFVILDKSEGLTSFKASAFLRRIYGEKKTGHTGTLDPMATGVLPVALGRATRFISFLPDGDKGYSARFRLGITTDTLDITGKVLSEMPCSLKKEDVLGVLDRFRGDIMQTPPMFSAISVGGKRLYELARKGEEIEREQRPVTIYSLELTECENGEFAIDVLCSKGTYIRSLIADIGDALGVGACMTALRRTRANGFTLDDAHTEEELKTLAPGGVLDIDAPFMCFDFVRLTKNQSVRFRNGGELFTARLGKDVPPGMYRVYSDENEFLGLGEVQNENPEMLWARRVV